MLDEEQKECLQNFDEGDGLVRWLVPNILRQYGVIFMGGYGHENI